MRCIRREPSVRSVLARSLPTYASVAPNYPRLSLAKKTRRTPDITLVLDLDETLMVATCNAALPHDYVVTMNEEASLLQVAEVLSTQIYVNLRPFVREFLQEAAKHFEVVIFTASEVGSRMVETCRKSTQIR